MKKLKIVSLIVLMGAATLPTHAQTAAPAAEQGFMADVHAWLDKAKAFFADLFSDAKEEIVEDTEKVVDAAGDMLHKAEDAAEHAVEDVVEGVKEMMMPSAEPAEPAQMTEENSLPQGMSAPEDGEGESH